MRSSTVLFQFIFIAFFILISQTAIGSSKTEFDNPSLTDKLNQILSAQQADQPGLSVLVKKNNKVIFKANKGLANKAKNIAISSHTGFRIGSISKVFTALAAMQLVERGKLSLVNSVTLYLSELPTSWNGITIEQLLTHRVNLSDDFFSDNNLGIANQSKNSDVIQFVSSGNIAVNSPKGNNGRYCNSCYVLLAEVVAKASGQSFSDFLQKNIFNPAEMKDTYIVEKGISLKPGDALNYAREESFFGIMQYTTGAMAQVSSVEDLNHFIDAFTQDKIVNKSTRQLMSQVHANLGDDGLFGIGWMIGWGDEPFFDHGGSQDGYQTELMFYPKYDLEIVILSNGGEATFELQQELIRSVIVYFKSLNEGSKT